MTYIADLSPCTYVPGSTGAVRSIGWLEKEHAYPQGQVQAEDIAQLERLILHGWQPVCAAGWHDCSLCGRKPTDGPLMRPIAGEPTMIGAANLFVPASDVLYVAPSLVIHYVEDHGYLPPEEFLVALRAVEPTSARYRQACRRLWGS